MNIIKRFLLLWILSMAILHVSADEYFEEGGIRYHMLSYGYFIEVTYSYSSTPYAGDIVVPANVVHDGQEYTVVGIGIGAFLSSKITSIKLPETISSIGSGAFLKCKELKEISIPKGVNTLTEQCFK